MQSEVIVLAPGAGKELPGTSAVTLKLSGAHTEGRVAVFEAADAREPGMHAHPGFDEMFYVLSGEYEFTIGARAFRARAGSFLYVPRGTFHTFKDVGTTGKILVICAPGAVEDYFEEAAGTPTRRRPGRTPTT